MGGTCGTCVGEEKCTQEVFGNQKERDHLEEVGIRWEDTIKMDQQQIHLYRQCDAAIGLKRRNDCFSVLKMRENMQIVLLKITTLCYMQFLQLIC